MNTRAGWLPRVQRFASLTTLVLVECVIWVNSANCTVAKSPLFYAGALALAALMIAGCIVRRKITLTSPAASVPVFLHVPLFVASALAFFDPAYAPEALAFGLSSIVFFLAGSTHFNTPSGARYFVVTLRRLTALLCIAGGVQYFFGDWIPLDFHAGTEKRVSSLFGNPEYFATFLVLLTPVMIAHALTMRTGGRRDLPAWILPVCMVLLLLATESRGGILGCGVSFLVFAALAPSRAAIRRGAIAGGVLLGLIAVTVVAVRPGAAGRLWELAGIHRSTTVARRLSFWEGGMEAFAAHPLTGHGIGSFERSLFQYRTPEYWITGGEDVVPHAHNEVVEVAVEFGIPGLLLFAGTLGVVLSTGIRKTLSADGRNRLLSAAIVSGIIGVAVDGLASVSLRQPSVALPVWMLMGFLVSPGSGRAHAAFFSAPLPRIPRWATAAPILACIAGFAAIGIHALHSIRSDMHVLQGVLTTAGQKGERVNDYREAVSEMPYDLAARSGLTAACLDAESWTDALASAEELQNLSPQYPKVHLMAAYALLRLRKPEDALGQIRLELGERSHPEAFRIASAIYRSLGDTLHEREGLMNLLRADMRGGIRYEAGPSMARLGEISVGTAEKSQDSLLSIEVANRFGPPAGVRTP